MRSRTTSRRAGKVGLRLRAAARSRAVNDVAAAGSSIVSTAVTTAAVDSARSVVARSTLPPRQARTAMLHPRAITVSASTTHRLTREHASRRASCEHERQERRDQFSVCHDSDTEALSSSLGVPDPRKRRKERNGRE